MQTRLSSGCPGPSCHAAASTVDDDKAMGYIKRSDHDLVSNSNGCPLTVTSQSLRVRSSLRLYKFDHKSRKIVLLGGCMAGSETTRVLVMDKAMGVIARRNRNRVKEEESQASHTTNTTSYGYPSLLTTGVSFFSSSGELSCG